MRQLAWMLALLPLLLAAGSDAAGARQLLDAPQARAPSGMPAQMMTQGMAPGPAPSEPRSDILFTVTAPRATLTANSLVLSNVAPLVQYITAESQAGVYTTGDFANSSAGAKFVTASGSWLDSPNAVLKGIAASSNRTSALITLASPRYNAAAHTLTFKTKIVPVTGDDVHLPTAGGVTHRLVEDAKEGLASGVLSAPPAGGQLTDAALFIDQSSQMLEGVGEVKWWGWRRPWGWRGGWGGGWWRPWGGWWWG